MSGNLTIHEKSDCAFILLSRACHRCFSSIFKPRFPSLPSSPNSKNAWGAPHFSARPSLRGIHTGMATSPSLEKKSSMNRMEAKYGVHSCRKLITCKIALADGMHTPATGGETSRTFPLVNDEVPLSLPRLISLVSKPLADLHSRTFNRRLKQRRPTFPRPKHGEILKLYLQLSHM